ncbi:hypothetical protein TPHA_0H00230 [Tetrapisispora phaffii CBS 4417]|uniref:VPS10 domain-containing protein n=1 Tax=Tetrapisispora phaffii (strain ATCC 24235 / CBS 4417 / NBRC 1672 / NRRL Y-8282 / UCD 70-5) TaxID=1071381 RepID=G8BWT0_TETPH|nr:hypothetical protein TPHA_0H00230 [Tetrapisispora phaffii CBS 4417]CCE64234.1 hypothetical protein TPHA_0H00230 [Tetrapisispora phaffii CBS 4417]
MLLSNLIIPLLLLFSQLTIAASVDNAPVVNKVKSGFSYLLTSFDDSSVLLRVEKNSLLRTEDNGKSWEKVKIDSKDSKVVYVHVDELYPGSRASLRTEYNETYITNDKGKTWTKLNINVPKNMKGPSDTCWIKSHPLDNKILLASCRSLIKGDSSKNTSFQNMYMAQLYFISTDTGKTFKQIDSKIDLSGKKNIRSLITDCKFGISSSKSMLTSLSDTIVCKSNLVQGIEQKPKETQNKSDTGAKDKRDDYLYNVKRAAGTILFNNGKSNDPPMTSVMTESKYFEISIKNPSNTKIIESLKEKTIESFFVFDQQLVAITIDDRYNKNSSKKVWISKDGKEYKEAHLPTQLRFYVAGGLREDAAGRLLLTINRKKGQKSKRNDYVTEILISDSKGEKFSDLSFMDTTTLGNSFFQTFAHLPGTIIGTFTSMNSFHGGNRKDDSNERKKSSPSKITKISIDNGNFWSNLKVVDPDNKKNFKCDIDDYENCSIQLLMGGFVSSEPSAGIITVIGVVSDGVSFNWDDAKTFISRDGGESWQVALDFPSITTSGDYGNIIVAVPFNPESDGDPESELYYSLDQGRSWTEYQLEEQIIPIELISTTLDGSGSKFMLLGMVADQAVNVIISNPDDDDDEDGDNDTAYTFVYAIDFSKAFNGEKCKPSDFETYSLASGECINGAKYSVQRRKAESKCLVGTTYKDLEWIQEDCSQCTEKDYECSFSFKKGENGKCVPDYKLLQLSGQCNGAKNNKITLSPVQKLNNNKCQKELTFDNVELSCEEIGSPVKSGDKIKVTENSINSKIEYYKYFDTVSDEALLIATSDRQVYVSNDGGETIKKVEIDSEIIEITFNPYFDSTAYLFGDDGTLYTTHDRGQTFSSTKLPKSRQLGLGLNFNALDVNQFIYYGGKDCKSIFDTKCHSVAYLTKDGGETFEEMLRDGIHCDFANTIFTDPSVKNMITCMTLTENRTGRSLVRSNDYFKTQSVVFDSIIGTMGTGEFYVVAVPHGENELRAYVTADGITYAEAQFPADLNDIRQESFTVLGSEFGSIFMHLAVNIGAGEDYGPLLKSNYNGTSFVSLERAVNRNSQGFVDFEKIQGLEGIIIINTIGNVKKMEDHLENKQLKSKITFNDGSDWVYIKPPAKDSEGKKYTCSGKSLDKCSLHLHGYTERKDVRDTFASGSAFGVMFGVGNVGPYLLPENESSTYLTTDGGVTWSEVKKGNYQWEYGDHGGILVLVASNVATDTISYSIDSGKTWLDYKFTGEKVIIEDIITVPRDSSMRFLLLGKSSSFKGGTSKIYTIDFAGSFDRQCVYDIENENNDDFDYISFNPLKDNCLFGHQLEYLKKNKNNCFVGSAPLSDSFRIVKNCSCTRNDFECDYNYYKANDGTCKLVEGLSPIDPSGVCKTDNVFEYFASTGYRKIPLSTCNGGLNLEGKSTPRPCPGKKNEFNKHHNLNGYSFSALFIIPFIIIAFLTWVIYDRGIRRNGGFSRFGEIRLGDTLIEDNEFDRVVNSVVRSGFIASTSLYSGFEKVKYFIKNHIDRLRSRSSDRRGPSYTTLFNDQFLDDADDLLEGHDEDANDLNSLLNQDNDFDIDEDPHDPPEFSTPFRDEEEAPVENVDDENQKSTELTSDDNNQQNDDNNHSPVDSDNNN